MATHTPQEGSLLRIYIGELDKLGSTPLYERIMQAAGEEGMAGVTILRGVESFGASREIHASRILRLSVDLPMVLEIVDTPEKIQSFMPLVGVLIEEAGCGGLVTEERVRMIAYPPA